MSLKPWEQEWKVESLGYEARVVRDVNDYVASAQYAYPEGPIPLDDADAVFIAAAPRLYRALEALMSLKGLSGYIASTEEWTEAMAALKAARGEE